MFFVLAAAVPVAAQPAAVPSIRDQWLQEQQSVRELMRMETEEASTRLQPADQFAPHATQSDARGEAADDALVLVGIYGFGKRMTAQVLIDGRPHLYRQGRAQPLAQARLALHGADAPLEAVYTLQGMSDSCVRLARGERPVTLCLHPELQRPSEQP